MNPAHKKYDVHPLIRLFGMRRMTETQGMDWLQNYGYISDNCVMACDVAPVDIERVEALFAARWGE